MSTEDSLYGHRIINWREWVGETQRYPDRSFLWGERVLPSSRLLLTCSAVGDGGMYPGFTVVKELSENARPLEDWVGDAALIFVGVDGRSEIEGSSSGDEGKSRRISRYPCCINPKNRTSRVYTLRRTSPKVAGISEDISPGSALEHS